MIDFRVMRKAATFLTLTLAAVFLAIRAAFASCGGESCPLDPGARWEEASLTFEVSQQYIDQDQPRVGTEDAVVGQIPADENEIRTVNRITTARATYRRAAWSVSLALPHVVRTHEHIADPTGTADDQRWHFRGMGDLEGTVIRRFGPDTGIRTFLSGGVKAPTGTRNVHEVDGDQPEPPTRPGTGSWDFMAGAGAEMRLHMGAFRDRGGLPLRASVNERWNGRGTDHYKVGNEFTAHLATDVPMVSWGALLAQTNLRVRGKDDVGDSDTDPSNTGGTAVYISPGFRVSGKGSSVYGLVQIPIYQRVNGIQLVSDTNLFLGVTHSFAR